MLRGEWEAERQQERAVWDAERAAAAQHAAQERAALEQQRVRLERELAALKADLQREQQAAARVKQESSGGWTRVSTMHGTALAGLCNVPVCFGSEADHVRRVHRRLARSAQRTSSTSTIPHHVCVRNLWRACVCMCATFGVRVCVCVTQVGMRCWLSRTQRSPTCRQHWVNLHMRVRQQNNSDMR